MSMHTFIDHEYCGGTKVLSNHFPAITLMSISKSLFMLMRLQWVLQYCPLDHSVINSQHKASLTDIALEKHNGIHQFPMYSPDMH